MPDLSKQPRRTLTWEELCRDPNLHDLPFKIETNDRGQIVMSPRLGYITKRRERSEQVLLTFNTVAGGSPMPPRSLFEQATI